MKSTEKSMCPHKVIFEQHLQKTIYFNQLASNFREIKLLIIERNLCWNIQYLLLTEMNSARLILALRTSVDRLNLSVLWIVNFL